MRYGGKSCGALGNTFDAGSDRRSAMRHELEPHLSDEDRHLTGNAEFVFAALGDVWGTASFESRGASDSKDVQLGPEHKDICNRLRSKIDRARKEYDRPLSLRKSR